MAEIPGPHPLPLFLALLWQRLAAAPHRFAAAIEGLKRYQNAARLPAPAPLAEFARVGGVRLLDAGGPTGAIPLVVVPSIINSARILDLAPGRSLLRYLAGNGHRVLLLDWGPMGRSERRLGLAGLVSARLLPLVDRLPGQVRLAGYCLGGTLAIAAGQLLGRRLDRLALVAAPWHFSAYPQHIRGGAEHMWRGFEATGQALGAVPAQLFNPLFWSLDEAAVVAKFESLAARTPDDPALSLFATIEDWAGSGSPIPLPAVRDLQRRAFAGDQIGRGRWRVRGVRIVPERISAPVIDFRATKDRIVPAATHPRLPQARQVEIAAGHVGMVVGRGAERLLWRPLSNWLHEA